MYRSKCGIGAFDRLQGRSSAAEHAERAEVVLIAGTGAVAVNPAPAPGARPINGRLWCGGRCGGLLPGQEAAHRVRDGVDQGEAGERRRSGVLTLYGVASRGFGLAVGEGWVRLVRLGRGERLVAGGAGWH